MERKPRVRKDKKREGPFGSPIFRKRFCRFCADKLKVIDYKDVKSLEGFIRERGRIVSRRFSGNCAKHQRRLAEAVKKARSIALLPYVKV
jgi:small subunit ribosomal protein S18